MKLIRYGNQTSLIIYRPSGQFYSSKAVVCHFEYWFEGPPFVASYWVSSEKNSSLQTSNCRNLIKIQFDGQNFPVLIKQNIYIFNHITGENNEATISRGWGRFTQYKRGSFMGWPTRLVWKSSVRNFSMPVSKYCCIPVILDRWCNGLNSSLFLCVWLTKLLHNTFVATVSHTTDEPDEKG